MKVGKYTKSLDELIESQGGRIDTSDAIGAGIPKDAFYRYVKDRSLEKQSHGVYLAPHAFPDEFALLQTRYPKAIFSHSSALYLHEMTENEPTPLSVTVGANYNASSLKDQGVRIHYVKREWYPIGISKVETPEGNIVRAYDKERTICDMVRRRAHIDIADFNYALKTYVTMKDRNLAKLSEYARAMNMESRIRNAIGVLL